MVLICAQMQNNQAGCIAVTAETRWVHYSIRPEYVQLTHVQVGGELAVANLDCSRVTSMQ